MNAVLIDGGISGWYRRAGLLAWRAGRALVDWPAAFGARNALLRTRVVADPGSRTAATVCADGAAADDGRAAADRRVDAARGEETGGAGVADGAGPASDSPGMLAVPDTTV